MVTWHLRSKFTVTHLGFPVQLRPDSADIFGLTASKD